MSAETISTKQPASPFTFPEVTAHFSPAWFAAIMGTAVIPLAISFIDHPLVQPTAAFFIVLAAVMFLAALLPWTLKFIRYPEQAQKDFNHPIAVNFFPTMPISLVLFALDLLKYPTLFFTEELSQSVAFYLWLLGAIGIYGMGFPILLQIFRHKGINLAHANFGWYIPPVSKLIIPVAGFELATVLPQQLELTFGLSMISFGVGFFLFLFVGIADEPLCRHLFHWHRADRDYRRHPLQDDPSL
jgi:tellurite resistance protein TehA-like permease